MRKSLIILLLLFVIGIVSCFRIGNNIYSKRNMISYQQTTNFGDISSAQGLKVITSDFNVNTADYAYNWQNELSFEGAEGFQSHTVFHNGRHQDSKQWKTAKFYLSDFHMNADLDVKLHNELFDFNMQKEYGKIVAVKDYFDYYPMEYEISILEGSSYRGLSSERKFAEFFRIPVLDDEYYLINENGINHINYFETTFRSISDDEAMYIWFSNRTTTGGRVDTSLIPGGYGIYRMPFGETDVLDEQLSTLCPLEEEAEIMDVRVFPQADQIVLKIYLNKQDLIRVIDRHTGELIREYLLPQGSMQYMVSCDDNYEYIDNEEKIIVIQPGQSSDKMIVTFDKPKLFQIDEINFRRNYYAYKDNRLAVVSSYTTENMFYLNVFDESGLTYSGTFTSNLSPSGRYPGIKHVIDQVYWNE